MPLSDEELNLIREWFDSVQDVAPEYLERKDYELAQRVYGACGFRVPNSIREKVEDEK